MLTLLVTGALFLFFFQAEDGIRDIGVTGVQTCALPICNPRQRHSGARRVARWGDRGGHEHAGRRSGGNGGEPEERRVGGEGRSRWGPDHLKKKKQQDELLISTHVLSISSTRNALLSNVI